MAHEQAQKISREVQILIADDEPLMLATLSRLLAGAGYQVHTARNGTEAVRSLETTPYDLVLLDLMMPGLTGHEVMDRIKEKK
ncbi:MAG: response regulator [Hydrogenophilales bacterium]|nr:response regulator [Hydrogenophilales bacterium]